MKKMSAEEIYEILVKKFPNYSTELEFNSNFELLVAVVLSSQCTDKRVNEVTKILFKKYNTPQDFACISQETLEKMIYSCGFYHAKAKHIISLSKKIIEKFDSKVPNTFEDLISLDGVGAKTANLVLSQAFDVDAIAVDTHVFRTSNRLKLSHSTNVKKCEKDLKKSIPKKTLE